MEDREWFVVDNAREIDSPALLIYKDRVAKNIAKLWSEVDNVNMLRPHVKTHKSAEITAMMLSAGIRKFKCATIAEAEMLATTGAEDILLAYQPVGPKAFRLLALKKEFPLCRFSCLIDNWDSAEFLSETFRQNNEVIDVFVDLNVGMNRTGIVVNQAMSLINQLSTLKGIVLKGLHAYDGHLRDSDWNERKRKCDDVFSKVLALRNEIEKIFSSSLTIVAGGTPTFSIHRLRKENNIECSPGTFIYWDKGYEEILNEQNYLFSALVMCRVISIPDQGLICVDLGHKAIASENPLPKRVLFLNGPFLEPVGHSEEHMVFKTHGSLFHIGDVLYGVPFHVCPTVALHDKSNVVTDHQVTEQWLTSSRNRKITI